MVPFYLHLGPQFQPLKNVVLVEILQLCKMKQKSFSKNNEEPWLSEKFFLLL